MKTIAQLRAHIVALEKQIEILKKALPATAKPLEQITNMLVVANAELNNAIKAQQNYNNTTGTTDTTVVPTTFAVPGVPSDLPVPLIVGGVGLLGVFGFVMWKRKKARQAKGLGCACY